MKKLRPFHTHKQLRELYGTVYDHTRWDEHRVRVRKTTEVAQSLIDVFNLKTVADYSCGDGAIAKALVGVELDLRDVTTHHAIEHSLTLFPAKVDLFICSETIEHLRSPWTVLEEIAKKTQWLVLSTPLDEDPKIDNYEHYWSFTQGDIADLLKQSGFKDAQYSLIRGEGWTYTYQLWTARSDV